METPVNGRKKATTRQTTPKKVVNTCSSNENFSAEELSDENSEMESTTQTNNVKTSMMQPPPETPTVSTPVSGTPAVTPHSEAKTPVTTSPSTTSQSKIMPALFETVQVSLTKCSNIDSHFTLSPNMVITLIKKQSSFFSQLVVGDQIISLNNALITSLQDFKYAIEHKEITVGVMRSPNISPPPKDFKEHYNVKTEKYFYFKTEISHIHTASHLETRYGRINKKLIVKRVAPGTQVGRILKPGDRIVEIDGKPVCQFSSPRHFSKQVITLLKSNKKPLPIVVERANSLRNCRSAILFNHLKFHPKVEHIGKDAIEIGIRESMRHNIMKGTHKLTSVVVPPPPFSEQCERNSPDADTVTAEELQPSSAPSVVKARSRKTVKKSKKNKNKTITEEPTAPKPKPSTTCHTQDENSDDERTSSAPSSHGSKKGTLRKQKKANKDNEAVGSLVFQNANVSVVASDAKDSDLQKVTSTSGFEKFVFFKFMK